MIWKQIKKQTKLGFLNQKPNKKQDYMNEMWLQNFNNMIVIFEFQRKIQFVCGRGTTLYKGRKRFVYVSEYRG